MVLELASLPLAIAGPKVDEQRALQAKKRGMNVEGASHHPQPANATAEEVGFSGGRWQLEDQIGQGSFGEVWQGFRSSPNGSGISLLGFLKKRALNIQLLN